MLSVFLTGMNEWYPGGLQISLHIRSPGLQDYSEVWNLKFFQFGWGGVFWNSQIWALWQFGWGDILKLLDLGSLTIFIWRGYSETLGFGLSDNFHWGVFWNSRIWTLWQFSFLGRGVFWNSWIWTLWQFSFLGIGVFWKNLDQNFNHSSRLMHHK